ncbi:MAG: hypothetical protein RLW62_23660 [Gammaproteobacteria bacterium]
MATECPHCGYLSYAARRAPDARCPRCREPLGAAGGDDEPPGPGATHAPRWTPFERRGALALMVLWQALYGTLALGMVRTLGLVGTGLFAAGATATQAGPGALLRLGLVWVQVPLLLIGVASCAVAWRAWRAERLLAACLWMSLPLMLVVALGLGARFLTLVF